jgi:ATP-dependent Clp protease ATP-binding subunit ClpC
MFEVFTDRARRVVVLAQEEARMLNHDYIGTEHLLLGLIHEGEGVAVRALESLGISLQDLRRDVEEMIGRGQHELSGHIPFTPRTKRVLELSLRESQQLGHDYIGTEHILLGLIREAEGVAAQVLVKLGADLNRVRQQVLQLLGGRGHEEVGESEAGGTRVAGAVRQSPPVRQAGPQVVGTPLQLAGILSRLADIAGRLDAIERHLGIGPQPPLAEPQPPAEPQQPDEPGKAGPAAG